MIKDVHTGTTGQLGMDHLETPTDGAKEGRRLGTIPVSYTHLTLPTTERV